MNLQRLFDTLNKEMEKEQESPYLLKVMTPGFAKKELYGIYLCETYHYTKHNARNQALVAARQDVDLDIQYMRYCFKHALEETGHEMMAFHDLKALGYPVEVKGLPAPLESTQKLIDYLYEVSSSGEVTARLGYSFWAERVYKFVAPLLSMFSQGLGIEKKAMTFFIEHSDIDVDHAEEVNQAINSFVKTPEEWDAVEVVLKRSLELTIAMTREVVDEFDKYKKGENTRYRFLL